MVDPDSTLVECHAVLVAAYIVANWVSVIPAEIVLPDSQRPILIHSVLCSMSEEAVSEVGYSVGVQSKDVRMPESQHNTTIGCPQYSGVSRPRWPL